MIGAQKKAELDLRDARIASAYRSGEHQKTIAEREGVSCATVSLALKKEGARLSQNESFERWKRAGHSVTARRKAAESNAKDLSERFFDKVERGDDPKECWEWMGALSGSGRPQLHWDGRRRQATHVSLTLHGKPRPGRLFALHTCDNPNCVNPAHLWWGTQKENIRDALNKGRLNTDGLALGLPSRLGVNDRAFCAPAVIYAEPREGRVAVRLFNQECGQIRDRYFPHEGHNSLTGGSA